jgi:hypothetical protein
VKALRKPLWAAVVAVSVAGMCPWASADGPTTQNADVSKELAALRARIDQLETQQKEQQQKADAEKQAATTESVLKDANRQSQFFDSTGITAGYKDHRFFIGSDDGNYVFRPWFHMQFRDVTIDRKNFKPNGDDDVENGFEMRRMRFGFDGNLFNPDVTYFFNWATVRASGSANVTNSSGTKIGTVSNNLGGAPLLEEAWMKYNFHNTPWFIKAGQIKDPLLHDQVASSRYQQSAERSITADIFANGDAFTEGATIIFDPKSWVRTEAGVTHGMRSANTNFLAPTTNGFDYGAAGRAEFKVMGDWRDYAQVGGVDIHDPLAVIGVGVDYSERGHAGQTVMVVDGTYAQPNGINVYGAFVDRYTNHNFGIYTQSATGASIGTPDPAVANHATNEYSVLGEVGYVFNNRIEPFGRYEYMRLQGTAAGSQNYVHVITAGANFFFQGNRLKLTPEIIYLPRGIPIDDTPSDTFTSAKNRGEVIGEIQLQLLL